MKFAVTLIKLFSGLLSAVILGAFIYYLQLYVQTKDNANLVISNIAFILFIISSITFALIFMAYDAYSNKNSGDNTIIKDIMEKLKDIKGTSEADNSATIVSSLQKLSLSNNDNNNTIIENFKSLSGYMQTLNDNLTASIEEQKSVSEQISSNITNLQQEKNNTSADDLNNKLDTLLQTVANLSTDINNLNGRTLDIIHDINKNISEIANNQNAIKDISDKLSILHPEQKFYIENLENGISNQTSTVEEKTSIADFYEQQIHKPQETSIFENDFTEPTLETNSVNVLEENTESFVEEPVSLDDVNPIFENDFTEPTLETDSVNVLEENSEPFVEEPVSLDDINPIFENDFTEPTLETASVNVLEENTEPFVEEQVSLDDVNPIFENDFIEPTLETDSVNVLEENSEPFVEELVSLDDVNPIFENDFTEPTLETETTISSNENTFQKSIEAPKEIIKEMPIYDPKKALIQTDNPELLASDDPFGNSISEEMPMYDPTIPVEEKIDLSFDDENQFGNSEIEIPVYEQTDEITSLEPDNPYGTPISDTLPTYEPPSEPEIKQDLSMDINEQFGAPINLDGEDYSFNSQPKPSTFNEDLANELANLDILKNDNEVSYDKDDEISLDDLLNGDDK